MKIQKRFQGNLIEKEQSFQQVIFEQLDIYMQRRMKLDC